LSRDPRLYVLSIAAPLIIIYFFKLFADTMPIGFPAQRYALPIGAFVVHFLSFLLCAIVLVQERSRGTLDRMLISGYRKYQIIAGYVLGYFLLATLQAVAVMVEILWLFDLSYSWETVAMLFCIMWLLAMVSVLLGIFISTFARNEGQVFPFIPLIILPSVFLSGLLMDIDKLPNWAVIVGKFFPLYYANEMIQNIIDDSWQFSDISNNFLVLCGYIIVLLFAASFTLKDTD
jgi:ABC-2 type transport system permease protein